MGITTHFQDQIRELPQLSAALSREDVLLGPLGPDFRINASFSCFDTALIQAVLGAEDKRFFSHPGIDWRAIGRALIKNLKAGRILQGGSTITQQLVRNVILRNTRRTISRKVAEACVALALESVVPKEQILEAYLNSAYFGHGIYGVKLAAIEYFARDLSDLNVSECAYLAGLLKGPHRYCHCCNPARAAARTEWIQKRMLINWGSQSQKSEHSPLKAMRVRRMKRRETVVSVHPATTPYFLDYVTQWLRVHFHSHFPKRRLIVKTSLDVRSQSVLEQVCRDVAKEGFSGRIACLIQDSNTGLIRALSGGLDHKTSPFNVASNGSLQPGSTFKPFLAAAAIKSGIPLSTIYQSQPLELCLKYSKVWKVRNYHGQYYGGITLDEALVRSDNTVFAQLILDLNLKALAKLFQRMGYAVSRPTPSISIGALPHGISPLQLCSSYSVFSSEGMFFPPSPVISVETENGDAIYRHTRPINPVISPGIATQVRSVLRTVVERGTGVLGSDDSGLHAKTGTTNEGSWYMSFDPAFRVLTWVETPQDQKTEVYSDKAVTAKSLALRIWTLLRRDGFSSTSLHGIFRGIDHLSVQDILWVDREFA